MTIFDLTFNGIKLEVHRKCLMAGFMSLNERLWSMTRRLVKAFMLFSPVGEHKRSPPLVFRYICMLTFIYWDLKSERWPLASLGLYLDRSLQLLNDHFRDGQAKTHPTSVNVLGFRDLPKELEELRQILIRHPDSCILYSWDELVFLEVHTHCERAWIGELDRVAQQVEEDLFEPFLVSKYFCGHFLGNLNIQSQLLLGHLEFHDCADLFDCVFNVAELLIDGKLIVLQATHVKGIFNHVLQV